MLGEAADRAATLLSENRDKLDRLSAQLEAREMLDDVEVVEIIGPATPRRSPEPVDAVQATRRAPDG